jgi:hypothetical protein
MTAFNSTFIGENPKIIYHVECMDFEDSDESFEEKFNQKDFLDYMESFLRFHRPHIFITDEQSS